MKNEYRQPNTGGFTVATRVLRRMINELSQGLYSKTDRLPSEIELSEEMEVSRSVIRDVLKDLEGQGFIRRTRGVGTRINREIVDLRARLDMKYEYNDLIFTMGYNPSTELVSVVFEPANEDVAAKLKIQKGDELIIVTTRMFADNAPVIFSVNYLPKALFQGKDLEEIDWADPIFNVLEDFCGITVDTELSCVKATIPDENISKYLKLEENSPLILLEGVGSHRLGRPIIYSVGHYTDFFNFNIVRKML